MRPPRLKRYGPVRWGWLVLAVCALAGAAPLLHWIISGLQSGVISGRYGREAIWSVSRSDYLFALGKLLVQAAMLISFASYAFAMAFWKDWIEGHLNRRIDGWLSASRSQARCL